MLVVPAIDLSDGRCVRLYEGARDSTRTVAEDPVAVARAFVEAGAERIHVVDLDGAFDGRPKNLGVIRAIVDAVDVDVEVGGGLRDAAAVDALFDAGVRFAMIGTMIVKAPDTFTALCRAHPDRILAGIDGRDGYVRTEGWTEASDRTVLDVARFVADAGACGIITTDITRDGTGKGVNVQATVDLATAVSIPVYASGGVKDLGDIDALLPTNVAGVIVGRAIYDGDLDLRAAIERTR